MKTKLKDEDVIRQYRNTNPNDCFEELYSRYVQKVYHRCYSMTKDSAQAQDFTQDIFIKMFAHLDRFQERSSFSTWLYSISHNYCIDQIKRGKRLNVSPLEEGFDYGSHDETDEREHTLQQLARAMESLSEQDAQILHLKYQDGLDVQQISQKLKINESAVKMRLKRSRDRVRQRCEATL